jgi:outer membrane protein
MKKLSLIVLAGFLFVQAQAQESWSLQKCIDYALTNNIDIKQYEISTNYQQNELQQSKFNRLPEVSASGSQNFSFGRSQQSDGTYQAMNTASTSLNVGASAVIYRGSRLKNSIVNQDFLLKKSFEDLKKAKDDVSLNIASSYLDILYAKELIKVSEAQVAQTKIQIERTSKLVEAGNVAQGTLLEIQSQLASEELDLVNQQNSLQLALLSLAQLLDLDDYANFDIVTPELPELQAQSSISGVTNVFGKAVENRPEIKSAEYQLKSSETQLKIAQGAFYPTLSASAGVGDNYYNVLDRKEDDFATQFKNNNNEYVGLSLNIPIFSKFQNKTTVANSKLQIENNRLALESAKKDLRKQIEQAYTNAVAALKRYNSNQVAVKSMQESFRYVEEKYNAGKVNAVEYNDSKSKLAIAESNLIQAKYEFIFRSKILDFYNGIPIAL